MHFINFIRIAAAFILLTLLSSCFLTSRVYSRPEDDGPVPEKVKDGDVTVNAADLLIVEELEDSRIVEVYKDDIQDNCERKFIDLYNYYRQGQLLAAKILFDNLLESLEYQYGDKKVSDLAMLQNFWDEFSDQNIKDSGEDIFDIYRSLYFDEELFSNKEPQNNELVVEQAAVEVKQNNPSFLYVTEKTGDIMSRFGKKAGDEFLKNVHESYIDYLNDRIGIKETYIRSGRYIPFIRKRLDDKGLDEIYSYVPGILTSFYNEKKNNGIWRLKNRKVRTDVGASTALVISELKSLDNGKNALNIIATVLDEGSLDLKAGDILRDYETDDMADFIALTLILSNPGDHELTGSEIEGSKEKDYLASYNDYLKNPKSYTSSSEAPQKSTSKYSKSFIRINYKVRKGDNLDKIADLFGVSISELKQWNPKDTSKKYLYPGMVLYVKGYKFQYYKARSGDSIGKICSRFKMKQSDFKIINGLGRNTVYKGRRYIVKK